jgi:hypothetical protein
MSTGEIACTLLSDGSSDRALIPILRWLLHQHITKRAVDLQWADPGMFPRASRNLDQKICEAVKVYPCDLIFVHRDAEREPLLARRSQVEEAIGRAGNVAPIPPAVIIVPVRMTEAWLLLDAQAIRLAAGNPNGSVRLNIPHLHELERVPDPKNVLHSLLCDATELGTNRRRRFDVSRAVWRVADYIDDFSRLRSLPAFIAVEQQMAEVVAQRGWSD